MKVLYHHRVRGIGAESVHIRAIVDALREQGHQVSILAFPGVETEPKAVVTEQKVASQKGSAMVALLQWLAEQTKKMPIWVFELVEILYNILIPFRLQKAINQVKPDFIYERYSLFMFASVWWAGIRGIPIVLEINDSALVARVKPTIFGRLAKGIERWIFKHCTGLVFISSYFRDLALAEYGEITKTVICPNAAELNKFDITAYDPEALKQSLGLAGKVVCGYTGAFVRWHGIVWFIEKIIPQLALYPNYTLLLVGDGVSFKEVQTMVQQAGMEQQIILTGRVKHSDVPRYLAAMDFGILPDSNLYGSPMKLFESMAMAKAMVVPDFSPIQEVVADGKTGWFFPANDHEACIAKVIEVFGDTAQLRRVGVAAREYIARERQWSHNVDLTLTLLPASTLSKDAQAR